MGCEGVNLAEQEITIPEETVEPRPERAERTPPNERIATALLLNGTLRG